MSDHIRSSREVAFLNWGGYFISTLLPRAIFQATALLSILPSALKALLMLLASVVIPATEARASTAATSAYSIRS